MEIILVGYWWAQPNNWEVLPTVIKTGPEIRGRIGNAGVMLSNPARKG